MNRLLTINRIALTAVASFKGISMKPMTLIRHSFNLPGVQQKLGFHSHNIKMYVAQQNRPEGTTSPLMDRLISQPHIMQQLLEFTTFLRQKGYEPIGKKLGYMQVMSMMRDSEVKERAQLLAAEMEKAGIKLDRSTVAEIQESLGRMPRFNGMDPIIEKHEALLTDNDDHQQQQHTGVFKRIRNFFK